MTKGRSFDLADLLTAGGAAMGTANLRLTAAGVPSLLRSFEATWTLPASLQIRPGGTGLTVLRPDRCAIPVAAGSYLVIAAAYVAAPSLIPVPPT